MTRTALVVVALLGLVGTARADEDRFTVGFRGGAFIRDDRGYADHAAVFGLDGAGLGGGGVLEGGVRVAPRLWLYASWAGFSSLATRRMEELRVTNQALVAQAGVTAFRWEPLLAGAQVPMALRVDVLAGGGLYTVRDELDGASHDASGPGLRAGAQATLSWRALGFTLAYGYHLSRASLDDRVGGALRAGGNEIGAGLSFGF